MDSYTPYLNWIDTQELTLLQRVKHWAAINTFSSNVEGLAQLLVVLQSDFKVLGGTSHTLSLPLRKVLNSNGDFHDQPLGQALRIQQRPQASIQVLLGGHLDTVYPPTSSFQTMQEKEPGIWQGPGVADMKGGIAILLTALEAFERSPWAQEIGWEILLTPDEEIGSPGSTPLYQEAARRHQVGLIFEPSLPDGAFVNQRKGSASYAVVIRGQAAHVGRDFTKGRSAVFALARFIHHLETFQHPQNLTINVTDIEGKGPLNIVPPLATCRINFRSHDLESLQQTSFYLETCAQASLQEGIEVEIHRLTFSSPKLFDTKTQQLFHAYANCAQHLDIAFQTRPTGGVCDGNVLAGAGLPTLDTAGAVGGALHTHEEYVLSSSLVERAKLAALFLMKLASREFTLQKEPS